MATPHPRLDPVVSRLLGTQDPRVEAPSLSALRSRVSPASSRDDAYDTVARLEGGDRPVRVYRRRRDDCVIVWFHGGGFVKGDLDSQDGQARMVADVTSRTVVSVDYRLAPEHPFPAAYDDAVGAIRWVQTQGATLLGRAAAPRVAVAGPSAGANLAVNAALALSGTPSAPVGLLLAYPLLGGAAELPSRHEFAHGPGLTTRALDWLLEQYLTDPADREDVRFSSLLSDRLSSLAPVVLLGAGLDPLRDDARAFADLLRASGGRVVQFEEPTLPHGFWKFAPSAPAARRAAMAMCLAFRAVLDG